MTDTPDEQPNPATNDAAPPARTPQENYKRAMQRLKSLHERRAIATGSVDIMKLEANSAMRAAELNAVTNMLVEKGICTLDELYEAIAVSAVNAGNKLFVEINTPRVVAPDGSKLNGS